MSSTDDLQQVMKYLETFYPFSTASDTELSYCQQKLNVQVPLVAAERLKTKELRK